MLKIQNFRVPLEEERSLEALVAKHYHLPLPVVRRVRIVRQAVDARRRPRISFVYTLGVELAAALGVEVEAAGQAVAGLRFGRGLARWSICTPSTALQWMQL